MRVRTTRGQTRLARALCALWENDYEMEAVMGALTFIVELSALDDKHAEFTSAQHATLLGIPAADWQSIGRPGRIAITITPSEGKAT